MKFEIEINFLVRTLEEIEINPKDFLHCATIEELNNEVEDYINNHIKHPFHQYLQESEILGLRFWDNWFNENKESFYQKWQELKGLPKQL